MTTPDVNGFPFVAYWSCTIKVHQATRVLEATNGAGIKYLNWWTGSEWVGWNSYVTNSDFNVIKCSFLTTANQIVEIPNCPDSSNYVPVITGYSNTHDYRVTISFTNGKWRIFSDVSQTMGISFYRLPSV